ncbi:MAG: ABC-F family ATP-binding cassette domain-containing protein [Lachnospiraceae bacterium]|nr:ABC-F family ATP-binding cassette domain-containing protein [Lachnospiraceae bacterium]
MSKKELIYAENIIVAYGDQTVLDFDRFYLYEGERVGLVGVNGAGKTTLLQLLAGERGPDSGRIQRSCTPFYFRQFAETPDPYALDLDEAGRMGVWDKLWQEQVSGGENTRLRLAELFTCERAVAFLDEPTANLDRRGIEALAKRLQEIETMVLVTHDRALCNTLCSRIVELSFGKLTSYDGNYDDYLLQKEEQRKKQQEEYNRYCEEKHRLERVFQEKKAKAKSMSKRPSKKSYSEAKAIAFIGNRKPEDKVRSMERSARNVQKRIEHIEVREKPKAEARIRPDFRLTNPPENPIVIRGEHVSFGYGDKLIFDDCSFVVHNRSKLAIIGDNGTGKTTLLDLIHSGNGITIVPKARIGYLKQNFSQIDFEKTVLENVREVSIQSESVTRTVLARLLLTGRDMEKPAGALSGGERMKLAFAMLFVSNVNLLMMDEPTNYLDIPSIEALEALLREYEGTLIFTSHDKTFVDHIATERLLVKGGNLTKQDLF